jgi:DNA polymerase (family 10)
MKLETNNEIAFIFEKMASIYKYLGADERFRAIAYTRASKVINNLENDISIYFKNGTLEDFPGIGKSIAEKIKEFITTGSIKKYELLKKNTPHELIEMLSISGFGPESLKRIHNELKISTKKELIEALTEGRVEKIKGFGKKKIEGMLRGLKLHKILEERMLLWEANILGKKIIDWLLKKTEILQIELAGSLRRKKETIGDIDILIACNRQNRNKIINHFTDPIIAEQIITKGTTKASIIMKEYHKQIDLRIVDQDEWGAAIIYFTGSKDHNIHLRNIAQKNGLKLSEYGMFNITKNKRIASESEDEIYSKLGLQMIPPEMREDKGELELAAKNRIPNLIKLEDIKGDLQIHSTWSDGASSIEDIVKFIKSNYTYEYIAITDHSKSSRIANGLDEKKILKQIEKIKLINEKLGEDFVKTGIEVDILPNGKSDISDEVLAQLQWVTASIHSGFNKDNTERVIKACRNPFVFCIGHPTGRLIGSREAYKVDMKRIIESAIETNTALEINAQPQRMDLKDEHTKIAQEKGVKLVISSDSHTMQDFDFMGMGVSIARRAWCTSANIINTMKWSEIEEWIKVKRQLKL